MNVELKNRKTMNIGYNIQNALQYGACEERIIENIFAETGYERKTTFFSDLSIAEWYGIKEVEDTISRVVKNWFDNVEMFTEFVMCVNHKSWEHYQRENFELSKFYSEKFYELQNMVYENWDSEAQQYYYQITD